MTSKIVVTVKEGKIRGTKTKSLFSGTEFYSFYGVPYGQPTSNIARYRDPIPVKPWKNIYDATEQVKKGCLQFSLKKKCILGSEDCLYNNIHTPKLPSSGDPLKAVIVNIHPGGFSNGSPDTYNHGSPDYVMHNDIVYVSIGYRLHMLGFLNLGIKECSGNQGLKDIALGLKWIKDNITAFGGDSENITLLGWSAGALIIHSLMLSPKTKGLFHKAIILGGLLFLTICTHWEENLWLAIKIAQASGYENAKESEKKKLYSFFKRFNTMELLSEKMRKTMDQVPISSLPCSPFNITVDTGEDPIFPVPPRELINSMARIPIMFGICEKETVMGFTKGMKSKIIHNFKTSFRQNCWGWAHHMTDEQTEAMFEEIKSYYLDGKDINDAPIPILADIQSDAAFSEIYDSFIDIVSAELPSSAYVYKFEFRSNDEVDTLQDKISYLFDEPLEGTFHLSDFSFWARTIPEEKGEKVINMSDRCKKMIKTYTKLIATFAKTGNPNYQGLEVEWKPTTPEEPCYLTINDSLNLVDGKINDEGMKFWDTLRKKYGKQ